MNRNRDQRNNQPTLKKMIRTILLFPFILFLLLMSLPLWIQLFMDISSIPDGIERNYVDKKMIEVANATEPFHVGEEKVHIDTMSIILYGVKEIKGTDRGEPRQYEYIGGHKYHLGYYEFGAQLNSFSKIDGKYQEDTPVKDFFDEIISIINTYDLEYKYANFPEEYYIGFDDDTDIEYEMPNGAIKSLRYGTEAAMSISFFSAGKMFQGMEDAKTVTFRLLFGNPEDSIEYAIGAEIKESLLRYMNSTEDDYSVYQLKNVVPLLNSGSWIPPDFFGVEWVE